MTIDDSIKDYTKKVTDVQAAIAEHQSQGDILFRSYQDFAAANDWTTAYERKDRANAEYAQVTALNAQLATYKSVLSTLTDQKAAANATTNAQAALVNSTANLTPDQLFALQQAQLQAATQANATKQAQAELDKTAADKAAADAKTKNKNMIIAIVAVVVVIGLIIYFKSKK